jgi:hypothetical protein
MNFMYFGNKIWLIFFVPALSLNALASDLIKPASNEVCQILLLGQTVQAKQAYHFDQAFQKGTEYVDSSHDGSLFLKATYELARKGALYVLYGQVQKRISKLTAHMDSVEQLKTEEAKADEGSLLITLVALDTAKETVRKQSLTPWEDIVVGLMPKEDEHIIDYLGRITEKALGKRQDTYAILIEVLKQDPDLAALLLAEIQVLHPVEYQQLKLTLSIQK